MTIFRVLDAAVLGSKLALAAMWFILSLPVAPVVLLVAPFQLEDGPIAAGVDFVRFAFRQSRFALQQALAEYRDAA